jgi:beta-glucosidase/6-phospho-beta-glucosidase/beta-galactosidase
VSRAAADAHVLELDHGFVVSTGIECSAPVIRPGFRQDELLKTGHWERYAEDFALIADFGMRYVRWGVPFHLVASGPRAAAFDWRWTDDALAALRDAGLEPILDLLHFGLPDDIGGVTDRRLVERFEAYVSEVVGRYPWVRYYTPVNEPQVLAVLSTIAGLWYERDRSDRALVAAIDNLVTCAIRGMDIIRAARPDAIFLQSDACEGYQAETAGDARQEERARFLNERRFLAFDLTYGRRPAASVARWLEANGMTSERLDWFASHGSTEGCIVGHDYYRGNEWLVTERSAKRAGPRRRGYLALAREYHARYGMPFMLSETNIAGQLAMNWLAETWADALEMRAEGLPTRGICWYGFLDHVDWDSALTIDRGRVNRCGLVSLDRRPHRVGLAYRDLAQAALRGVFAPLPDRRQRRRTIAA